MVVALWPYFHSTLLHSTLHVLPFIVVELKWWQRQFGVVGEVLQKAQLNQGASMGQRQCSGWWQKPKSFCIRILKVPEDVKNYFKLQIWISDATSQRWSGFPQWQRQRDRETSEKNFNWKMSGEEGLRPSSTWMTNMTKTELRLHSAGLTFQPSFFTMNGN